MGHLIIHFARYAALLSLVTAAPAAAQTFSSALFQVDANGNFAPVPGPVLPEFRAWIACETNVTGGATCYLVTAPINDIVDGNGNGLAETCETLQADFGMELAQPQTRWCSVGQDPAYRPQYTDLEASAWSITPSQPGTLGSTYTEGASFVLRAFDGSTRTLGDVFLFLCTGLTLNNTRAYCRFVNGAADLTQDDAEMRLGRACTKVQSISHTWYDNAGTARSASPSCTVDIGRSVDNSDSGTLGSVSAGTSSGRFTPSSTFSWTDTNEVSLWINGNCSGATRSVAFAVECY
jgi:hypothetical protein